MDAAGILTPKNDDPDGRFGSKAQNAYVMLNKVQVRGTGTTAF